jgi:hypothetical protein
MYTNFETNQIKEIKSLIEKIVNPSMYDNGSSDRQRRIKLQTDALKFNASASLNLKSTGSFQIKKRQTGSKEVRSSLSDQLFKLPPLSENRNRNSPDGLFSSGTILKTIDRLNISSETGQLRKLSPKNKYDPYELSKISMSVSESTARSPFVKSDLNMNLIDEKATAFALKKKFNTPSFGQTDFNLPNVSEYINRIRQPFLAPVAVAGQTGATVAKQGTHVYHGSGGGGVEENKAPNMSRSNSFIIYDTSLKSIGNNHSQRVSDPTSKTNTWNPLGVGSSLGRQQPVNSRVGLNRNSESVLNDEHKSKPPTSRVSKHSASGKFYVDIYMPSV